MKRKILAAIVIIILAVIPVTYALLTYKVTLPATVIINPASAAINIKHADGTPAMSLDFGSCSQQGSAKCSVIIENIGQIPIRLNMTTQNIGTDPPPMGMHGEYLSWDCEGTQINPGSSIAASFTYRVNMMVGGYNVARNFDVSVNAIEVA